MFLRVLVEAERFYARLEVDRVDFQILGRDEERCHGRQLKVTAWQGDLLLVVKAIHQVYSLKDDALVLDLELGPNLEEPVDDACSQVARDLLLGLHQVGKLALPLLPKHVLELLDAIIFEEFGFVLSQQAVGARWLLVGLG